VEIFLNLGRSHKCYTSNKQTFNNICVDYIIIVFSLTIKGEMSI